MYLETIFRALGPSESFTVIMLNLRAFCLSACLILGSASGYSMAQPASVDAEDWDALKGRRNIFALRRALETGVPASDGVRALGVAYIGAFSRDFEIAEQNLTFAHNYAAARGDRALAREVDKVERVLLREQGAYKALGRRLAQGPKKGSPWQRMVNFWAETPTRSRASQTSFVLENISPDDGRIVLPVSFGQSAGNLLFDTGAQSSLLSRHYAEVFKARPSDINYRMLTVDGERKTQLARLETLKLGAMEFENLSVGVQGQSDGVIGFFLNKGATGILGFPEIAHFGVIDFAVSGIRVETVRFGVAQGRTGARGEPNMMIREDKPYIKVEIEDAVYSCIFDTGSPRSIFSRTIIARHEDRLGLSYLSVREAKQVGLSHPGGQKADYIASLPVYTGHRDMGLEFVQVTDGGGPSFDFCLIGLDAVINSGGGRMDMDSLQVHFGQTSSQGTRAFNLR